MSRNTISSPPAGGQSLRVEYLDRSRELAPGDILRTNGLPAPILWRVYGGPHDYKLTSLRGLFLAVDWTVIISGVDWGAAEYLETETAIDYDGAVFVYTSSANVWDWVRLIWMTRNDARRIGRPSAWALITNDLKTAGYRLRAMGFSHVAFAGEGEATAILPNWQVEGQYRDSFTVSPMLYALRGAGMRLATALRRPVDGACLHETAAALGAFTRCAPKTAQLGVGRAAR